MINGEYTDQQQPGLNPVELIASMGIEGWRFAKVYLRMLNKMDASEQAKYQGQLRFFLKQLEEKMDAAGLKIVNLEGQAFDPGFPINVINLADFEGQGNLVIEQMLEPIIMGACGVVKQGTALVKRC